jgi:hypothetical protein
MASESMNRSFSVDDLVGGIFRLGQAGAGAFGRTDSEVGLISVGRDLSRSCSTQLLTLAVCHALPRRRLHFRSSSSASQAPQTWPRTSNSSQTSCSRLISCSLQVAVGEVQQLRICLQASSRQAREQACQGSLLLMCCGSWCFRISLARACPSPAS